MFIVSGRGDFFLSAISHQENCIVLASLNINGFFLGFSNSLKKYNILHLFKNVAIE